MEGIQNFAVTLKFGRVITHNCRAADPLDEYSIAIKKITDKRGAKTQDDHRELSRLQFLAGMWLDEDGHPSIPDACIEKMFEVAATKAFPGSTRKEGGGTKAKSSVQMKEMFARLEYDGSEDPENLFGDSRFVFRRVVNTNPSARRPTRGISTRPIFKNATIRFTLMVSDGAFGLKEIEQIFDYASTRIGIGDWRPKYGKFEVVSIKQVK